MKKATREQFLIDKIDNSWGEFFGNFFGWEKLTGILEVVENDYNNMNCYPAKEDVLRLFRELPLPAIKVVIIGQDPYHQPGVADGFAFSTRKEGFVPASLRNILTELNKDTSSNHVKENGDLTNWVQQGVFLMNTSLTVREAQQKSHSKFWQPFTHSLADYINRSRTDIVWVFWGKEAKMLKEACQINSEVSITGAHPSPFSALFGFFGSKPFSKVNDKLALLNKSAINWCC